VLRAVRYPSAVIGGQRSGATATFAWSNGVATVVSGSVDVDCATSRQSQRVCEAPAASWAQQFVITPFLHIYTTVRTLPGRPSQHSPSALPRPTSTVFGATVSGGDASV
jgi:hypothetical protein